MSKVFFNFFHLLDIKNRWHFELRWKDQPIKLKTYNMNPHQQQNNTTEESFILFTTTNHYHEKSLLTLVNYIFSHLRDGSSRGLWRRENRKGVGKEPPCRLIVKHIYYLCFHFIKHLSWIFLNLFFKVIESTLCLLWLLFLHLCLSLDLFIFLPIQQKYICVQL